MTLRVLTVSPPRSSLHRRPTDGDQPRHRDPGGGFPVYGAAFTDVVNANEPTLRIEPRNTRQHRERASARGRHLDIALVQGEVANPALARSNTRCESSPRCTRRRGCSWSAATAPIARSPTCAASRSRSARRAPASRSSGGTCSGDRIDPDRDIQAIYLERAADGPAMVLDGRAAALWARASAGPVSPPSRRPAGASSRRTQRR